MTCLHLITSYNNFNKWYCLVLKVYASLRLPLHYFVIRFLHSQVFV